MKKTALFALLSFCGICTAQSVVQSVNSGSVISSASSVSVGEIVVNPVNPNQASSSGLIGILAQNQTLEVGEFELASGITVYPNPTTAGIYFKSNELLANEKVAIFNANGQLVMEKTIDADHSVDMSGLTSGIYLIQLSGKQIKSFKIIKH